MIDKRHKHVTGERVDELSPCCTRARSRRLKRQMSLLAIQTSLHSGAIPQVSPLLVTVCQVFVITVHSVR